MAFDNQKKEKIDLSSGKPADGCQDELSGQHYTKANTLAI